MGGGLCRSSTSGSTINVGPALNVNPPSTVEPVFWTLFREDCGGVVLTLVVQILL